MNDLHPLAKPHDEIEADRTPATASILSISRWYKPGSRSMG
jgi:hypothetical protein